MFKPLLSLILCLGLFNITTAYAKNQIVHSQQFLMADQSELSLSLTPSFSSYSDEARGKRTNNLYTTRTSSQTHFIKLEKGLNEISSLSLYTFIGDRTKINATNDSKDEFKYTGMGDLTIGYRSLIPKDESNVIWGGDFVLTLNEHQYASTIVPGNNSSGGHSVRPFIGYEHAIDGKTYGWKVSYHILGERKSFFKNSKGVVLDRSTTSGGNDLELLAFAEIPVSKTLLGASVGYNSIGPQFTADTQRSFENDQQAWIKGSVYGNITINEDLMILPTIRYSRLTSKSIDNSDYSFAETLEVFAGIGIKL